MSSTTTCGTFSRWLKLATEHALKFTLGVIAFAILALVATTRAYAAPADTSQPAPAVPAGAAVTTTVENAAQQAAAAAPTLAGP